MIGNEIKIIVSCSKQITGKFWTSSFFDRLFNGENIYGFRLPMGKEKCLIGGCKREQRIESL
jgi:hypothetical protein